MRLSVKLIVISFGLSVITACGGDDPEQEGADATGGTMGEIMGGMEGGNEPLPTPIDGCIGPLVEEGVGIATPADAPEGCVTCEGASAPNFKLLDTSPTSCGVGRHYGLEEFVGKVTFVVLLRSICGYCHAQLERLEQMRFELLGMGLELNMVVINEIGTEANVDLLTQRAQIPVLQDVEAVNAWGALSDGEGENRVGGDKDDMYIYDATGKLWRFLDDDNPMHKLNLSTEEGYAYLRGVLLEALGM